MVDSCRTCPSCREGLEQYCDKQRGLPSHTTVRTNTFPGKQDVRRLLHTKSWLTNISACTFPKSFICRQWHRLLCARDYSLLSAIALGHWPGQGKIGHRGAWRPGSHGREALACVFGAHTVAVSPPRPGKNGRCTAAGRPMRVVISRNAEEMEEARNQLRSDRQHGSRPRTIWMRTRRCLKARWNARAGRRARASTTRRRA